MISAILSILGSSTFGSLLGGVFAFLNRKNDLEIQKLLLAQEIQKLEFSLKEKAADLEIMKAEAEFKFKIVATQTDSEMEKARFDAIARISASEIVSADTLKEAGSFKFLYVLSDFLNRIIRPVATILLTGAAIWVNFVFISRLHDAWASYTQAQQYDAAMQAFSWITGQSGAILAYWFVSRGVSKK